jgi:ABC-2 type transport system ATP-binding protein
VTIIVTTHFMQEAEYCDQIAIMDAGRVLAQGSPAQVRELGRTGAGHEPRMDDAFIAVVGQARERQKSSSGAAPAAA